ncbi:MAG TPA: GAF domain-containing protein [Frankiaceae bacterium]|nr:GAF domain-containing protein [Frankiaceae bacterium]
MQPPKERSATSVVVVTRNATLPVGLIHQGYDVADVRPDKYGEWMGNARWADALVLELSDAVAAEAAVQRLRSEGLGVPVLLVSNDTPGWDATAAHVGGAARVLPLPISLGLLTAALDELLAAGPLDVPPPPSNENELLSKVAASVGLAISDSGTLTPDESSPLPRVRVAEEPPPSPVEPLVAADPEVPSVPIGEFAESVLAWASERSDVRETAEVVVAELAERTGAEAAALLLPDGAEWRVAGGVGLRPLEHRLRLGADHWLVSTVVEHGEGVVVDDSDGARDELIGAPLASWARVLAVPVPAVRGVFVAAREGEAFDGAALATAVSVAGEANPMLTDALALRAVARALAPFTDVEE